MFELVLMFFVGVVAGLCGTLVGGGALLPIPILILLGLPAHVAIGTTRLGIIGLSFAGWWKFHKKKLVDYKLAWLIAVPSIVGAIAGAFLVFEFSAQAVEYVVAGMTIFILVLIIFNRDLGVKKRAPMKSSWRNVIGVVSAGIIGVYSGFMGGGVATFYAYLLVLVYGQTFIETAGTRKPSAAISAVIVTGIFAWKGVINYSLGLAMLPGMAIGSDIGAKYSDKLGNVWIKRLFVVVVLVMVVKMLA
ncbi:sulfite exporter TauE/SafE family protein [Candidatus Peregrinibacteria bacterium]|nr:sulfite exporter TauE/SafE family protein [Candidatus Peregrinibacteria bacterium]